MFASSFLSLAAVYAVATLAAPTPSASSPTVQLDNATFIGTSDGTADSFLGIKFADAPRFNLPVPVGPYTGTHTVDAFGLACPQQGSNTVGACAEQLLSGNPGVASKLQARADLPPCEDCLNLNVYVPTGTNHTAGLPVVVWIFGGGFQEGSADNFDGGVIVKRSVELGEPVIYVAMNYRRVCPPHTFGFIAGKEVKAANVGNIGLEDQRVALRWIQKYITAFGGDPNRVTIWGASAGAISAALHMLTNGGDTGGLFHGAFMQSGGPIPVGDISRGQAEYDKLVQDTPCGNASDTLECLRALPYATLKQAVDQSPNIISKQSLRLPWLPRVDGRFLTDTPFNLVVNGSIAPIPQVSGNVNDEGTLFSIVNSLSVWDDAAFRAYFLSNYLDGAPESVVGDLFDTDYPDDPTQGSPFGTGTNFSFPPEYKRLAAIQGDLVFQAPRRFFVGHTYNKQPTWSFLSKRKPQPELAFLGSSHGSDVTYNSYAPGDMTDYLVHFVNHRDPNGAGSNLIDWPRYDNTTRQQMTFVDDDDAPLIITNDTYRVDGFNKLIEGSFWYPL